MAMNDSGPRVSRASTMSNSATTNASSLGASALANADDSASSITVNTKVPANFPPPKTDKPRPHVCSTCQRSFARLEHLKRHERSHTKEKPFECPECSRCFARRDLLLRHQQKLHQTSTPSSRPRNRRESTSGVPTGQSRARKNSVAGVNSSAAAANPGAAPMRPRANTISHVDGAAMQMIASANASVARGMYSGHNRHQSLAGLPIHGLDQLFGGDMPMTLGQRGINGLPKLETVQIGGDYDNGLRAVAPGSAFNSEFDFESFLSGAGSTINPNALHYNDSPPSMALEQTPPFLPAMNDLSSSQVFDDSFDWLSGFEHQMSFQTNDNVVDESSPSALSTTSQSGMSDVMVDGSNHPLPAGTSAMWQASVMGPPQMPNPFAMDLNGSVFPDLLNGAPLSPQPASQKINDPYFSTPPPLLSSLSPSVVVSGLTAHHHGASPVTTVTDATRNCIVNMLSQCLPYGGRKHSFTSPTSPQTPLFLTSPPAPAQQAANVPSTQNLQRYVAAYLIYFHPHLPFLHLPTLSFDVSPSCHGGASGVGGSGCLVLAIAAIGALYEGEHAQSQELFDMAKRTIFFHLEERRKADVRKADARRSSQSVDHGSQGPQGSQGSQGFPAREESSLAHTPVWLVQAMLLSVIYGHNCADKPVGDMASTHCAALVSLAQAADLGRREAASSRAEGRDARMADDSSWARRRMVWERDEHEEWLQWRTGEERKRTLYAVFIVSSWLVTAYNHTPALTNSEILLDLPCDEEFFAAETSSVFLAKGGVEAANHNRLKFCDALGDLLRTNEKQQRHLSSLSSAGRRAAANAAELPTTDMRPSTFGCLVLINALHNYIWETRQRHHNKVWTSEETEKMHRHIEPALRAWQAAWSSNGQHSVAERTNRYGMDPLSVDAIPLLDLAYVRLFVNLSSCKDKFWQRDWGGMAEELSRGSASVSPGEPSPSCDPDPGATDMFDGSIFGPESMASTEAGFPGTSASTQLLNGHPGTIPGPPGCPSIARRERHLRRAAAHAVDSLAMSGKLGVAFAAVNGCELPLQSTTCAFDCAQVLAEWLATLQDRVGRYLGVLGRDAVDMGRVPALMLLEEDDVKLLDRVRGVLAGLDEMATEPLEGQHEGFAAGILGVTAQMLDKVAVWPATRLMARCLETQARHMAARAGRSVFVG